MKNRFLFLLLVFLFFAVSCKVSVNIPKGESINKNVTILPAGTDGSGGTEATYVLYGKWPQSLKADDVTITSETKECGLYTYYRGSDGEYYCKYDSSYYKVEPIKWRSVSKRKNGDMLLISETILTKELFYDNISDRIIDDKTIHASNYEYSRIRAFLNGISYIKEKSINSEFLNKGFFQTAFSSEEQKKILITNVNNSVEQMNPDGKTDGYTSLFCNDTNDYVFIPSINEITSQKYGFESYDSNNDDEHLKRTRIRKATDFFKAVSGLSLGSQFLTEYDFYSHGWWTRSTYPKYSNYEVYYINHRGCAEYVKPVNDNSSGVIPEITVSGQ